MDQFINSYTEQTLTKHIYAVIWLSADKASLVGILVHQDSTHWMVVTNTSIMLQIILPKIYHA